MLVARSEQPDPTDAIHMMLRGHLAEDRDTGAYLVVSYGRNRTGAGRRYVLVLPIPPAEQQPDRDGYTGEMQYHRFRAESDAAALAHARAFLAKRQEGR